jgi:PLP dependent protein
VRARIAAVPPEKTAIAENVERVRDQIARAVGRARRRVEEITLVAVSKTFSTEAICAAYDAGLRAFGENRVQEFEAKRSKLNDAGGFTGGDVTWHLVGHLQSNKARRAAELFDRIDSVDSLALANKLDSAAAEQRKRLPVLIEVNLGGEKTKSGVGENDVASMTRGVAGLKHLELGGLMTIPPFFDDPESARPYFRQLRELRDGVSREVGRSLPVLSMGMSHDFEVAIEEGATEVRIGTAIFGERRIKC